jgi:hypothetical protein
VQTEARRKKEPAMLRRTVIAVITVLVLAGSAELIRSSASAASGQAPRHTPTQIPGLRPQPQPQADRWHGKRGRIGKKFSEGPSVDVTSIFLQAPTYQTGGSFPYAMAVIDVNRDGIPDMLVAQCGPSCNGLVGVLLGKGDGTFRPAQTYGSGGFEPDGLIVADVNGDGNPDVVVANSCAGQSGGACSGNGAVAILLGNGDGTFQPAQVLDTGALYASSVAVADVNGDGKPDLVVTNQCTSAEDCSGLVAILLGNGDGTFQPAQNYSSGGYSAAYVAVGDVNSDGKPDVLIADRCTTINNCSGHVGVLLGNGDGTFQSPVSFGSAGIFATAVALADVNGDGKLDMLVLNECAAASLCDEVSGSLGVLLGNGDGTFQAAQVFDAGGEESVGMSVADVNGDGKLDVLVASRAPVLSDDSYVNGAVGVLLGNGDGTFRTAHIYNTMGWAAQVVAVADVNGDGKPDVLVANGSASSLDYSSDSVAVMLGCGDGSFQAAPTYSPGGTFQAYSAAMADLNGDGKTDLVVTSYCLTILNCIGAVDVLLGQGDGTFQPPQSYASGGYATQTVTIADVNGDGIRDLLVADQCLGTSDCGNTDANGSVDVLLGNADGSFKPAQTYDSGGRFANSIVVADVNGDGKLDLVVGNQCLSSADCSSGAVTVLLGKGDGTFQAAQAFSSGGYSANSVLVADVNGDGIPDLLVADTCLSSDCAENGQVAVLFGNGDGTFQAAQTYDSGSTTAHSLLAADVNGDGKLDLIVSNSDSVGVLLGNGDGTFQSSLITPAAYGYQGHLVAADFNGDGKLDIASSDGSLLLGNGDGTFTATTGLIPPGPGIAVGDLNGDGKPDLAIGGVTILLNIASRAVGTTTSLASSLNPSQVGQDVMFTSIVTPTGQGMPTGSVTFNDGTTVLGTIPLANGTAALTVSNLTVGTHAIGAFYSGDSKFSPSTSPELDQVVNSSSPAVINVTETIHVADSPNVLPSAMIAVAEHIKVTDAPVILPSTLIALNETIHVTDAPVILPSTLIAVNETIHVTDAPVITTAKVAPTITWPTPVPIAYGTPLSGTQLDASANVAGTFVYTPPAGTVLGAGSQTLSVLFTPTDTVDYTTATANVVLVVNRASTAVLLTSSINPQLIGQPVIFTAAISSSVGGSVTGSVVFVADGTTLGTVAVGGNAASLTTSFSANGNHSITASYSGDSNYAGSSSAPLIEVIAAKSKTTLKLGSSQNPSSVGQAVTFTAIFGSARPPDGELITFKRGAAVLGTDMTVQGAASFTTPNLPVGVSNISAHYLGDGIFRASSASLKQTVNPYSTTTTLVSNLNPATYGQTVGLTATVATQDSGPPTRTVTFRNGSVTLKTVTLGSDGTASLAVGSLPSGVASLTATYNGDPRYAKSTSPALDETINPASSTTTLSSSRNPCKVSQSVTFTAAVKTETGVSATGTVMFTAGASSLGTVKLTGGKAHISTSSLPRGANVITATYSGSADIEESSATLSQQVN